MQTEDVRASIGREAGVGEWLAVTQDLIDDFAALTGDRQWIHVDPDRARRESPFGATVVHGFLTLALLSRLVSQAVDLRAESKMRVNYGFNRLRFPAPVRAGARIRARVTPNAVRDVEWLVRV
jgi:acyl dehydratase